MGFISRLLGRENGCSGGHLFGEFEETGEIHVGENKKYYNIDEDGNIAEYEDAVDAELYYRVDKRLTAMCKFDGCHEYDEMLEMVGYVPESDIVELAEEYGHPEDHL